MPIPDNADIRIAATDGLREVVTLSVHGVRLGEPATYEAGQRVRVSYPVDKSPPRVTALGAQAERETLPFAIYMSK